MQCYASKLQNGGWTLLWISLILLTPYATGSYAATNTAHITVNVTVMPKVTLDVPKHPLLFDTTGSFPPYEIRLLSVWACVKQHMPIVLSAIARDDLQSEAGASPAAEIQWEVKDKGKRRTGRLSRGVPQTLFTWYGPGQYSGRVSYSLVPSDLRPPSIYATTVVYTVSAP